MFVEIDLTNAKITARARMIARTMPMAFNATRAGQLGSCLSAWSTLLRKLPMMVDTSRDMVRNARFRCR